jgi:hypothetical protein
MFGAVHSHSCVLPEPRDVDRTNGRQTPASLWALLSPCLGAAPASMVRSIIFNSMELCANPTSDRAGGYYSTLVSCTATQRSLHAMHGSTYCLCSTTTVSGTALCVTIVLGCHCATCVKSEAFERGMSELLNSE